MMDDAQGLGLEVQRLNREFAARTQVLRDLE